MAAATVTISSREDLLQLVAGAAALEAIHVEVCAPEGLDDESRSGWEIGVVATLLDAGASPGAIRGVAPERIRRIAEVARALRAAEATRSAAANRSAAVEAEAEVVAP